MTGWTLSPDGRHVQDPGTGWEPLWLTADTVVEVAREHFGVPASTARLLPGGYLNQTWRVSPADGDDRVVRVSRPGRTVEQVVWERRAALIWHAAVPETVVAETATIPVVAGHPVTLFPYVDADPFTDRDATATEHRHVAEVLARLHRAALADPLPQRPGFTALDDDIGDLAGWRSARTALLADHPDGDVARAVGLIDAALDGVATEVDRLADEGLLGARAQAWNDLNPRNRLHRDGRLVGLVDTDDCCVQPLVWELGKEATAHPGVSGEEFVARYRAACGPVDAPADRLWVFARIGTLTELMWLRPYGDVSQPLSPNASRHVIGIADQVAAWRW